MKYLEPPSLQITDSHWRSLYFFNYYRLSLSLLLVTALWSFSLWLSDSLKPLPETYVITSVIYVLLTSMSVATQQFFRRCFNLQLGFNVLSDVICITIMMHTLTGLKSGMGVMLLVSIAGASLVGQGRLVLWYASLASLAILSEQTYRSYLTGTMDATDFLRTGLFCSAFFGTAIAVHFLALRVLRGETLARQRGIALENQMMINQKVIESMHDGVLVLNTEKHIVLINPMAQDWLGMPTPDKSHLEDIQPDLVAVVEAWLNGRRQSEFDFETQAGRRLRIRCLPTGSSHGEILLLMDDLEQIQKTLQQVKLAALGRLTAGVAHEIRNPLAAIRHAAELLHEDISVVDECSSPQKSCANKRLSEIILDNSNRLELIVRDVLELGRRDRATPEPIDIASFSLTLIDDLVSQKSMDRRYFSVAAHGQLLLMFDRTHLYQIMRNLLDNAARYASGEAGCVQIKIERTETGRIRLRICDDGPGLSQEILPRIFEPFFTTSSQGTGLGLYIAKELCEANNARLTFDRQNDETCFVIEGECCVTTRG